MQKSSIFVLLALFAIVAASYWKLGFNTGGGAGASSKVVLPSALLKTPAPSSEAGSTGGGGDTVVSSPAPPGADDDGTSGGGGAVVRDFEGGGDEIAIDKNFKDSDPMRCVDLSNEDNPDLQMLIHRMRKFRFDFKMHRKVWGDVHVFPQQVDPQQKSSSSSSSSSVTVATSSSPALLQDQQYPQLLPPVMRQFLYCFTHNYVGDDDAPENSQCLAEMADLDEPVNGGNYFIGSSRNDLKKCTNPPIYQGNITSWSTLAPVVQQFPGPLLESERTLSAIAESRTWYWKHMPDPFKFTCPTCVETKNLIAPSFLVGTRRWFPIVNWLVMAGSGDTRRVYHKQWQCLAVMETGLRTTTTKPLDENSRCTGKGEPVAGAVDKWEIVIPFSEIVDVAFALLNPPYDDGFVVFTTQSKKDGSLTTHVVQPIRGLYGSLSIWTSLQMLFGFDVAPDRRSKDKTVRRGLFSPQSAIFPRNITANVTRGCNMGDLFSLQSVSEADVTNRRRPRTAFTALKSCWVNIISTSQWVTAQNKQHVPIFYRSPVDGSVMQPQQRFTYMPCYPPYTTALLATARRMNNVDSHDVYWPKNCKRIFHRRPCLNTKIASMLRLRPGSPLLPKAANADAPASDPAAILQRVKMSDLVRPRVAVCLAGFIRSFHLTRHAIFQNLVDPYDADFFASTWNVQGRAKKTLEVLKGHIINVDRMQRRLLNLIPKDRNVTKLIELGRYRAHVFSWNMYRRTLAETADLGWRHAGLYMLLSHSVSMAMESGREYDFVFRSRWDVVPLSPLMVYPVWVTPDRERRRVVLGVGSSSSSSLGNVSEMKKYVASWMLDTGAACEMDGFVWPRTVVLRAGVVVAHTADTRFKLFSWQYCDWLHIATFETMKNFARIGGQALGAYWDSGAQFAEHSFAIDAGLRFYPMQLYLKILRETRKKKKGKQKAPPRIRMNLWG